jgi:hypothetical protein
MIRICHTCWMGADVRSLSLELLRFEVLSYQIYAFDPNYRLIQQYRNKIAVLPSPPDGYRLGFRPNLIYSLAHLSSPVRILLWLLCEISILYVFERGQVLGPVSQIEGRNRPNLAPKNTKMGLCCYLAERLFRSSPISKRKLMSLTI